MQFGYARHLLLMLRVGCLFTLGRSTLFDKCRISVSHPSSVLLMHTVCVCDEMLLSWQCRVMGCSVLLFALWSIL